MVFMMNKVAEEGTGKRALLDGVKIAGKTGTTNNYRDAWFVGYSGNMVGGIWIGNDDYSSTNRMTGGALPAMTWHTVMEYAHQGIEIKPLLGLPPPAPITHPTPVASAEKGKGDTPPPPVRPTVLTQRGAEILVRIERMMEDVSRALAASGSTVSELPAGAASRSEALASAGSGSTPTQVRGN
jgi:penicillin-binding protein 1A